MDGFVPTTERGYVKIKATLVEEPNLVVAQIVDLLGVLEALFSDTIGEHNPRFIRDHLVGQARLHRHSVDSSRAHVNAFFCKTLSDTLERCGRGFRQELFDELRLFFVDDRPTPLWCLDENGVVPKNINTVPDSLQQLSHGRNVEIYTLGNLLDGRFVWAVDLGDD